MLAFRKNILKWLRLVHKVALRKINTKTSKVVHHELVFNELGHGAHADNLGDIDEATNRGCVQGVAVELTDELAIDLQRVDRQMFEVAE